LLLGQERPPTAIVASNDDMAIGAMNEAKTRGMRVPLDISVVSFDDVPFAASYDPPLTTIRQPFFEMVPQPWTRSALLEGGTSDQRQLLLPTELVIRRSTAAATGIDGRAATVALLLLADIAQSRSEAARRIELMSSREPTSTDALYYRAPTPALYMRPILSDTPRTLDFI
jgi:hypothetical protein